MSPHAANFHDGSLMDPERFYTEVGHFHKARSAHGTLDQAGNVFEWTDGLRPPFLRTLRGGAFDSDDAGLNVATPNPVFSSISDVGNVGFRVAAALEGHPVPGGAEATGRPFPRRREGDDDRRRRHRRSLLPSPGSMMVVVLLL